MRAVAASIDVTMNGPPVYCQMHCKPRECDRQTATHATLPASRGMCASSSLLVHISWLITLISMSYARTRLGCTDRSVQSSHTASRSVSPPLFTPHPIQTSGSPPCLMFRGSVQMSRRRLPWLPHTHLPRSTRKRGRHRHLRARHPVLSQSTLQNGGRSYPVSSVNQVNPYRLVLSCSQRAVSPLTPLDLPGLASK